MLCFTVVNSVQVRLERTRASIDKFGAVEGTSYSRM